jgi:hypothetical protein
MQITRLHVLILLIVLIGLGIGAYHWRGSLTGFLHRTPVAQIPAAPPSQLKQAPAKPPAPKPTLGSSMDVLHQEVVMSVGAIGEAYRPLRQQFGDIPPISQPLRAAKKRIAEGRYDLAMVSARQSWSALKTFRSKVSAASAASYQVARGDTLWSIAQSHSPVRQGPGWVTIWKANKATAPDFDRIEVGMVLKIPQKKSQYVMPFWRPRNLVQTSLAAPHSPSIADRRERAGVRAVATVPSPPMTLIQAPRPYQTVKVARASRRPDPAVWMILFDEEPKVQRAVPTTVAPLPSPVKTAMTEMDALLFLTSPPVPVLTMR